MIECFCSNFAKTYFCQNQAKERFAPPLTESGQQGIDLDRVLGEDGNQNTFEPVLEFLGLQECLTRPSHRTELFGETSFKTCVMNREGFHQFERLVKDVRNNAVH